MTAHARAQRRAIAVSAACALVVLALALPRPATPAPMSLPPEVSPVCTARAATTCDALLARAAGDVWGDRWDALTACLEVASVAERYKAPVELAVALAWHESRFDGSAVSREGAVGVLQVLPRYWCPDGCYLPEAGVLALKRWLLGARDEAHGVARYNGGWRPPERSERYARAVVALADELRGIDHARAPSPGATTASAATASAEGFSNESRRGAPEE